MILLGDQIVKMGDGSQKKLSDLEGGGDSPYAVIDTTGLHLWPASGTVVPGIYQKFLTAVTDAWRRHVPILLMHTDESWPGEMPSPYFVNCWCVEDSIHVMFLQRDIEINSDDSIRVLD